MTGARVRGGVTEKVFQQQVVTLAKWCGWWVHHPFDSRRSSAGWPDLVLLRPPVALFVEVKTDHGRISDEQAAVLRALAACGLDAPRVASGRLGRDRTDARPEAVVERGDRRRRCG